MTKIIFETDEYVRSHGKQPRGRGSWAFEYADASGTETLTAFSPSMTLTEAKAWFKATHGEDLGSSYVAVLP